MSKIKFKDILNEANTSGDSKYFKSYESWTGVKTINMYNARTGRVEPATIVKVKSSSLIAKNNHGVEIEVKFKDIDVGKKDGATIPVVMNIEPSPKEIKALQDVIKATGKSIEKIMDKAIKDIYKTAEMESPVLYGKNLIHDMNDVVWSFEPEP